MKKIIAVSLIVGMMLATIGIAFAQSEGKADTGRYLVKSNNGLLKRMYGVRHKFDSGFTTELTRGQLKVLSLLGVETEEVGLYQVVAKPICNNNGICESGENPSCKDCKKSKEVPPEEPEPICGNNVLEVGEECDDGNLIDGDGCNFICEIELPQEPPGNRTCYPTNNKPWGIERVNGGSGGEGIKVAVLDTGVDITHPDLRNNIIDCKDFTKGDEVENSCVDDAGGYTGHGTHVAGTIAADGGSDGLGIIGVAPEAKIMGYKVCVAIGCYYDDIAAGIDYAGNNGADIISMSIGGFYQSGLIRAAIDRHPNVLYVAAAGNNGPEEDLLSYPAANVKVIAVGAIDVYENVPDWSSRGGGDYDKKIEEYEIEFGAPGVEIESTFVGGCYKDWQGTSMATPHISGLAAKVWDTDAATTRTKLQNLARDIWIKGYDRATGLGLPAAA